MCIILSMLSLPPFLVHLPPPMLGAQMSGYAAEVALWGGAKVRLILLCKAKGYICLSALEDHHVVYTCCIGRSNHFQPTHKVCGFNNQNGGSRTELSKQIFQVATRLEELLKARIMFIKRRILPHEDILLEKWVWLKLLHNVLISSR